MKLTKKEISLLRRVIGYVANPHCAELHHAKKDRHCLSVDCPVETRLRSNVSEAYKLIEKLENDEQQNKETNARRKDTNV